MDVTVTLIVSRSNYRYSFLVPNNFDMMINLMNIIEYKFSYIFCKKYQL